MFSHGALAAADIASRARAYGVLVSNGYPDTDAREVAGPGMTLQAARQPIILDRTINLTREVSEIVTGDVTLGL